MEQQTLEMNPQRPSGIRAEEKWILEQNDNASRLQRGMVREELMGKDQRHFHLALRPHRQTAGASSDGCGVGTIHLTGLGTQNPCTAIHHHLFAMPELIIQASTSCQWFLALRVMPSAQTGPVQSPGEAWAIGVGLRPIRTADQKQRGLPVGAPHSAGSPRLLRRSGRLHSCSLSSVGWKKSWISFAMARTDAGGLAQGVDRRQLDRINGVEVSQ